MGCSSGSGVVPSLSRRSGIGAFDTEHTCVALSDPHANVETGRGEGRAPSWPMSTHSSCAACSTRKAACTPRGAPRCIGCTARKACSTSGSRSARSPGYAPTCANSPGVHSSSPSGSTIPTTRRQPSARPSARNTLGTTSSSTRPPLPHPRPLLTSQDPTRHGTAAARGARGHRARIRRPPTSAHPRHHREESEDRETHRGHRQRACSTLAPKAAAMTGSVRHRTRYGLSSTHPRGPG